MKTLVHTLIFGRNATLSGAIAFGIVMLIALGCTCGKNFDLGNSSSSDSSTTSSNTSGDENDTGVPDDATAKALVKTTTASFANAVSTEDFSQIYADSSDNFKKTFTEQQMKEQFKVFIDQKSRVTPILSKATTMEPQFTDKPSIREEQAEKILVLKGKYATKPLPVNFDYEYVKRFGQWKMLILKIFIQ